MSTQVEREKMSTEARASLQRLQAFQPQSVAREADLGKALNFAEAVPHVARLVDLYKQFPLAAVEHLNLQRASQLKQTADADFNRLQEILRFDGARQHPKNERDSLISNLQAQYEQSFEVLMPLVAYASTREADYAKVGMEVRALAQRLEDESNLLRESLKEKSVEAEAILETIRKVAGEQGVSQQAIYFRDEAESHAADARRWLNRTVVLAVLFAVLALASLWLHRLPGASASSTYEAIQLTASKLLVFAALGHFLLLAARNFMAHRHNAVVNRHRQNALVTFKALVDASAQQANKDIVLAKAAECIFGAQATGFAKTDGSDSSSLSILNMGAAKQLAS